MISLCATKRPPCLWTMGDHTLLLADAKKRKEPGLTVSNCYVALAPTRDGVTADHQCTNRQRLADLAASVG